MPIAATEFPALADTALPRWAATDPVEPIHDHNIPIPTYKHPPTRQDFIRTPHPGKKPDNSRQLPEHPPADDGHIDEYA